MIVAAALQAGLLGPAQKILVVSDPDRHLRWLHIEQMVIALGPIRHAAIEAGLVEQLDAGDQIPAAVRANQRGQMAQQSDPGRATADNADDHRSIPCSLHWSDDSGLHGGLFIDRVGTSKSRWRWL